MCKSAPHPRQIATPASHHSITLFLTSSTVDECITGGRMRVIATVVMRLTSLWSQQRRAVDTAHWEDSWSLCRIAQHSSHRLDWTRSSQPPALSKDSAPVWHATTVITLSSICSKHKQLNPSRPLDWVPALIIWCKGRNITSARWQVILFGPILQVAIRHVCKLLYLVSLFNPCGMPAPQAICSANVILYFLFLVVNLSPFFPLSQDLLDQFSWSDLFDRSKDVAMPTNFWVRIDEIGLFTFICHSCSPKQIGISQWR